MLEKILESPLDGKEMVMLSVPGPGIDQSILKKISPEYSLIGRTDAEAETLVLWPPDAKN